MERELARLRAEVRLLRQPGGAPAPLPHGLDLSTGELTLTDALRALLGLDAARPLFLHDLARFATGTSAAHLEQLLDALSARRPFALRTTLRAAHGGLRALRWCGEPVVEADGGVRRYECVMMEDAAPDDRARQGQHHPALQVVTDSSESAVIVTDARGVITLFNGVAEKLLGRSAVDVIGRPWSSGFHDPLELAEHARRLTSALGEQVPAGFEALVARTRRGGLETREWSWLRKDGTRRPVSLTMTALRNQRDEVTGFVAIANDALVQRERDASRSARVARIEKIGKLLPGVVFQYQRFPDGRSCFPWSTEAMQRIYGFTPDEVRSDASKVFSVVHPHDLQRVQGNVRTSAETLTPWKDEYRVIRDGEVRWLLGNAKPERLPDGSTLWHGFITDITERKRVEEDLERARQQAVDANRVKSEFLANMSHEMRTPLNGILGMAQLLREGELSSEHRALLEVLHASGETLLSLVNDILDLSKVEAGRMDFERVPFSPLELLQRVVQTVGVRADEKKLPVRLVLDSTMPTSLEGDPLRVAQVLTNLAGNAVKFTARGEVRLEASWREGWLRVAVNDTGIGIPESKLLRIFEPFTQGDGSISRRYGGTGLGLSISRRLAEQMGGRLHAESRQDVGSSFVVELPLGAAAPANSTLTPAPTLPDRPLRVLLAEDNEINALVATRMLQRDGHAVTHVKTGRAAVKALREASFDLVLMDLQMPEMDGLEATRVIRREETGRGASPCVIWALTANAMQSDLDHCVTVGMNDTLTKPLDFKQLRTRIERLTRPGSPALRLIN